MGCQVTRPVVRQFSIRDVAKAARHVRSGGHAVVWDGPQRARLVVPYFDSTENPEDLGLWAILDLYKLRYQIISRGALRGFIETRVPRDCLGIARRRAVRDDAHDGALRTIRLDCLQCGACCNGPEVILEPQDIHRFDEAGQSKLHRRPWARRKNGKVVLVLNDQERCRHHRRDHRCRIYDFRPNACREFPVGSEGCLSARGEVLSKWDGHDPLADLPDHDDG